MTKLKKVPSKFKKVVEYKKVGLPTEPSTSSHSSKSSESKSEHEEHDEEEEGQKEDDIFDYVYDSDSDENKEDEDLEPEPEYLQRKTLVFEPDFFLNFTNVPDIEDISEDVSVPEPVEERLETIEETGKDVGVFVDPITGEQLLETESIKPASEETVEEEESEESDSYLLALDVSEISDLVLPDYSSELNDAELKPMDEGETLHTFLELKESSQDEATEIVDWEALQIEEDHKRTLHHIKEFINTLMNKVVDIVEHVSPEKSLRQNLDKKKLIIELAKILSTTSVENRCCEFLNRQIVTYFRRKSSFRSILPDNPRTLEQDKQKFDKARKRLDEVLATEAKLKKSSSSLLHSIRRKCEMLRDKTYIINHGFENSVRKHLQRENTPKLNVTIEQLLRLMRKSRKDINSVRFSMIIHQHTEAKLTQLMNKLEDLGNGLTVRDYNNLQAETQALDKKVEERNNDLNKFYIRCRNNTHALSHYVENQKMATDAIAAQKNTLKELVKQKHYLRQRVFQLKIKRADITSQIKKLSAHCGILDKPALMMDYDMTVKCCAEKRALNDYLRRTMVAIEHKIDNLLKQNPHIKTSNERMYVALKR